jgi:type IV pilus assembly protein PilE
VKKSSQGFTLIELMIVIVVASILFFVALPAYQETVRKSNRNAARGVLMDIVSRQEQFFINNKQYAGSLDDLGYPVDGNDDYWVDNQSQTANPQSQAVYRVELVSLATLFYQATPVNVQVRDTKCNVFTLEQTGTKGVTGASLDVSLCW